MSQRTPKTILMEKAVENPNQVLVAIEVNGQINVEINFKDIGGVLVMLHVLEMKVRELVGARLNYPNSVETAGTT